MLGLVKGKVFYKANIGALESLQQELGDVGKGSGVQGRAGCACSCNTSVGEDGVWCCVAL